jgi:5-methyltetrahydropteroyltriglutamate--homocysteine methyltransferase
MQRSDGRICTTHTGSLPRTPELRKLLIEANQGRAPDPTVLDRAINASVDAAISTQVAGGIDVGSDGEQGRFYYSTYAADRMTGFAGATHRPPIVEFEVFPEWASAWTTRWLSTAEETEIVTVPAAVGDLHYDDELTLIGEEIARFRAALDARAAPFTAAFMNAASPGVIATMHPNEYFGSRDDYLEAIAREMRKEYEHVVSQGFVLQIDAPDLAAERLIHFREGSLTDYLKIMEKHVEVLNQALDGLPAEQLRVHCCWGNYPGPHVHDVELKDLLGLLYQVNAGALVLPFANPRHAHELEVFEAHPLPDSMTLVVGVLDVTTDFVEHPRLVADRLVRAAQAVGDPSRIMAGADCGFATGVTRQWLTNDVISMKLRALRDGADLASERLW